MTIQPILIGNYANDGTGDDLRTAFEKVNANFLALSGTVNIINGTNVGGGAEIFKDKDLVNLRFKTLTSTDNSVTITHDDETVNLKSTARISSNQLIIDMGPIVDPIDTVLELGYITGPFNYSQNSIDFGSI